ncbi:sulfotransferase, partial [Pseudomonadota bacterium]
FDYGHGWSYDYEALADFYNSYVTLMHHWQQLFPDRIYSIRYESLVSDFDAEARKLVEFCDLEWEPRCMEFYKVKGRVKTASHVQVNSPVHTQAVEKWKHYAEFLLPLEKRLLQL